MGCACSHNFPPSPAPRGAAPWLVQPEAGPRVLVWVGAQLHDSCTGPVDSRALLGVTLTEVPRAPCSWVKFVLEVESVQGVSLACGLLKDGGRPGEGNPGCCHSSGGRDLQGWGSRNWGRSPGLHESGGALRPLRRPGPSGPTSGAESQDPRMGAGVGLTG